MTQLDQFAEALDAVIQLKADTDLVHKAAIDRLRGAAIDREAVQRAAERLPQLAARAAEAERKAGLSVHAAARP